MRGRGQSWVALGIVVACLLVLGGGVVERESVLAEGTSDETAPQESIDFGSVFVGQTASASYTFTLLETSDTEAWVTVYEPCSPFAVAGLEERSFVLMPGQSVTFSVTFSPASAGSYTCSLRVVAQGGYPVTTAERVVPLTGQGVAQESAPPVPAWTPFASPFTFAIPAGEATAFPEATWVVGTTSSDGRFSVLIPPAATVSGLLRICGGAPLANASFTVAAAEEGYLFTASGYDVTEARATGQFSLFGVSLSDVGEICLPPLAAPSEIELLAPAAGEALGMSSVEFCWTSLGRPDLSYEVVATAGCDPVTMASRPHPFAPLIPDPQLADDRRTARAERGEAAAGESSWRAFCDALQKTLAQAAKRLGEVETELAQLELGRARVDAADARDINLPLPTSCNRSLEELFAPYPLRFDDLAPCGEGACEEFAQRIRGLMDKIQSLDARSFVLQLEFGLLLDRWERGAEHRGTMALWADIYSFVDDAIGLITDALDSLTPDVKAQLEAVAREYLLERNAANLSPEQLDALNAAAEAGDLARGALNLLKDIRASGSPSPAFFIQMVQAMAQQASSAARKAVEGWDAFAAEMAALLWNAYDSALCTRDALAWLASQEATIKDLCEACLACQSERVTSADAAVAQAEAAETAAAGARTEYWNQERGALAQGISAALASIEDLLFRKCCSGGLATASFHVPGTSDCERVLEDALKATLGDRVCFLTFDFEFSCSPDGFNVAYSHSFPLAERRPGCCVPDAGTATTVARTGASGASRAPVCAPQSPGEQTSAAGVVNASGDGDWRVEARDAAGTLVAASAPRALGPRGVTAPRVLPVGPVALPGCTCAASVLLNGAAIAAGGSGVVSVGAPSAVACGGDCGPSCAAGIATITIAPPPLSLAGPSGVSLVPRLPVVGQANQVLLYDFPRAGVYSVTATRTCEDGSTCSATILVTAVSPPSPVPRTAQSTDPLACTTCGDSDCLALSFRSGYADPAIPVTEHRLAASVPEHLFLRLDSQCRRECHGTRAVRWEITDPLGAFAVIEGEDLYEIDYSFNELGEYYFCVIERAPCSGGTSESETWLVVDAAVSD